MTGPDPTPGQEPVELLDTSVLCRYLLNDHPGTLSARAAQLIESDQPFQVSILVLAEAAHVLRAVYARTPQEIAEALILLLERENMAVAEVATDRVIEALEMTAPGRRVSVPDALLWALAGERDARVWTFDRRFPSAGIEVREPAPFPCPTT